MWKQDEEKMGKYGKDGIDEEMMKIDEGKMKKIRGKNEEITSEEIKHI